MKVRFIYSQLAASLSSPTHSNEDQVQQPTPTETKAKAKAQIKCELNTKTSEFSKEYHIYSLTILVTHNRGKIERSKKEYLALLLVYSDKF